MKKLRLYWIITMVVSQLPLIVSAQHTDNIFEKKKIISSKHWLDIDYVGDKHIGHKLDIHLPENEQEKYPVVISIYGSAFLSNNSKSATFSKGLGQVLLNGGYAVVTINHRASSDAIFPAQIQDVKAAIRFIRANASAFSLDTSFIGITGWSSGGHLGAFTGASNGVNSLDLEGDSIDIEGSLGSHTEFSSRIDAVVDWYGPTNFLIMDECGSSQEHDAIKSPESLLVGGAIQSNKDSAPFLIVHGDKDPLVPHCQSEYLHNRLKEKNIESEFITVKGGKHGLGNLYPKY